MLYIKSLRLKAILSTLIPIALLMAAVAFIVLYGYERVARDVVEQRDTELARVSAARLSMGLSQYSRILQSVALENDVRSMKPARLNSALENVQLQLAVYDAGVVIYDSKGVALVSQPASDDRLGRDFPVTSKFDEVRMTLRPAFSDVLEDEISGEDVILIGVPIVDSGTEFKGVLAGMCTVKYSLLGSMFADVLEFKAGRSGYAYLVDGKGQVIYHRYISQVGENLGNTVPVMRATRGETDAVLTEDATGEIMISGFAPVPDTSWGLITQERWESIVGPIRGYSNLLLGLWVAGGILSCTVIFFFIGRILKPIQDLTRGAERIAGGDFDYTIVARTGDEIEALARQFNAMSGTLKESFAGLEQRLVERKQAEEERELLLAELETKNRELESFVYTVSHDLKAPLVSLDGFSSALQKEFYDQLGEKGRHYLERLKANAAHMDTLIVHLLELSRIGKVAEPIEEVDVSALLREIKKDLAVKLKKVKAEFVVQEPLPVVLADRGRIRQVFNNLIDNAVKFRSEERPLRIEVGSREERGFYCFRVADNGIGIAPQYQEQIFVHFQKLNVETEGVGIGLALVKKIVEHHSGRVWVECPSASFRTGEKGEGAAFYFTLPRKRS